MNREPLFNVPTVVAALVAIMALINPIFQYALAPEQQELVLKLFAFIPARYDASIFPYPGGFAGNLWTFVTYSFLHASWMHFGVNAIWFLPFGSAVARRFGTWRFLAFFAVTAAAGAAMHLATHAGEQYPMIGASAAISGTMAAAMRFAFQRGGPLGMLRTNDEDAYRVPALPLSGVLRDARVLLFLAVWFGVNIVFGVGTFPSLTGGETVAWQAHIGGFIAGLLLFAWFDPAPDLPQYDDSTAMRS